MKTVKEVSHISGVSVRTLHHYDAIGLLKPAQITEAGYRLYDEDALGRLQTILMLKTLEFPLKEIKAILDAPNFDAVAAMEQQIKLLELRRAHLDGLIAHAHKIKETGVISMNFKPFDTKKLDTYAAEAKEKWGATEAYKESEKKNPGQEQADALMAVFAKFGAVRTCDPAALEVQQLVELLQNTITQNYYNCTKQILAGLGQMYVADDRFRQNIDAAGGAGTAEFAAKAIEIYCK
jgi:DNA-binding transcriptional MerR regulator